MIEQELVASRYRITFQEQVSQLGPPLLGPPDSPDLNTLNLPQGLAAMFSPALVQPRLGCLLSASVPLLARPLPSPCGVTARGLGFGMAKT